MVRRLVFLVRWPVTQREAERDSFDYLRGRGLAVEVFDLSELINGEALRNYTFTSALQGEFIQRIRSYAELEREVGRCAADSVFIDYVMGLSHRDLATERVFRILKKHDARYFIVAAGCLPPIAFPLRHKLRQVFHPRRFADAVFRRLSCLATRYHWLYPLPDRIFATDSEALAAYFAQYRISRDRVVRCHSFDYETYLRQRQVGGSDGSGTCVFLDEAVGHHSDFAILNLPTVNEATYLAAMTCLFDAIEAQTGLRVVVAAHPRSQYEQRSGAFGGREIVKGKTVELAAGASLIVAHGSTSVCFAVLFRKPLLIVRTAEMEQVTSAHVANGVAAALGLTAVNIDEPGVLDNITRYLREPCYDDYLYKYVKSRGVEDVTVWELVVRELERMNKTVDPALAVAR